MSTNNILEASVFLVTKTFGHPPGLELLVDLKANEFLY